MMGVAVAAALVHKSWKAVSVLSSCWDKFRRPRSRHYQNILKHRNARAACGFRLSKYSRREAWPERMTPSLRAAA